MTDGKRKRGRPLGSGKNDDPTLMQTALLMVRDPTLKPTTAMKRVIAERRHWPETYETLLRRLQVKWRVRGETLLARARRELEPRSKVTLAEALASLTSCFPQAQQLALSPEIARTFEAIAGLDRSMNQFLSRPEITEAMKALHGFTKMIQDASASPFLQDLAKLTSPLNRIPPEVFRSPPHVALAAKLALDNANLARVANSVLPAPIPRRSSSS